MQIIPVIDLLGGHVVRGIAGRRESYRPIESRIAADSRPATIARALVERFGFGTAYVADLDAIMHGRPDVPSWGEIAAAGLDLLVDAGTGDSARVRQIAKVVGAAKLPLQLILGLESLASPEELRAINDFLRTKPPIFSLDLKAGKPITRIAAWQELSPIEIANIVGQSSAGIIVLDLADVGTGRGASTLPLCRELREANPNLRIIAGGGVRGVADLRAMDEAGCDGALVASALHDGRLTAEEVGQVTNLPH